MKVLRLTTEQFDNLLKTFPTGDFHYSVIGEPVRISSTFEGVIPKPRYFEYKGVGYLEDLGKNKVYEVFLNHVTEDNKYRCEVCIEQMYSKGFISAEEYRLQLSDILPFVDTLLPKVLFKVGLIKQRFCRKEIDVLLENLSLNTEEVLPLIAEEMENCYG